MHINLFTECQSGFIPGDSCVSQLLSITHKIYKSFYCNPPLDTRGTFLVISKAFDKIWYEDLIFKLQLYVIQYTRQLIDSIKNYQENCKQIVVLNDQTSFW